MTKENYIELSTLFHNHFDAYAGEDLHTPVVTFGAMVKIIELFMSYLFVSQVDWKDYPEHQPQMSGYYMAIDARKSGKAIVGCAFYSMASASWTTFIHATDEDVPKNIIKWGFFPDAKKPEL